MADLFESRYAVKPSAVRTPPAPPAPLPDPTPAFTQRAAALGIAVKAPPVVDQERTDNIVRPKTPPVAIKSSSLLPSSAEFTPRSKTRVRFDPSLEISSPATSPAPERTEKHQLPTYLLPGTLRSSSIGATTQPSPTPTLPVPQLELLEMAKASNALRSSRYATGSGVNPIASAQGRQADIKARLAELKLKQAEDAAKQEKARKDAENLEAELAAQLVAELEQEQDEERAAEALRLENERLDNERIANERLATEKEAQRLQAHRAAKEKEAADLIAQQKAEAQRVLNEKKLAAETAAREADEKKQAATAAQTKINEEIQELSMELMMLEREENGKIKVRAEAGTEVQHELTQTDARVQEISKKKEEVCKMVEKYEAELVDVQGRLSTMNEKSIALDDQLLEAKVAVEKVKKKIADVDLVNEKEQADFTKVRDQLVKKLDQLKLQIQLAENVQSANISIKSSPVKIKTEPTSNGPSSPQAVRTNGDSAANVVTKSKLTNAWPAITQTRDESQVRSVKLIGLPQSADYRNVFAVVWGGNIQRIMYTPGAGTAEVQFVRAEDCAAYFDATPNGIRYPGEPERFITVEKCVPEPSHDIVKSYIDRGVTRCVRVQNVDSDWTRKALAKLATGNGSSRRIAERIVNGQNTAGQRIVDFRFIKISDAVAFKGQLDRDAEWETATINHGVDPCARHNAPHVGLV